MRPPASSPPSRRRCRLSAPNPAALRSSPRRLGPPHLPTGQVLSLGLGPRPPRGPARGGATRGTLTPLCCSPPGGERPTRVSPSENSGHAHPEPRLQEVGQGLNDRHAHLPGWPRPHACFPGCSLCLRPSGFPAHRPPWESCLVHSATCWSWGISQHPQLPELQCQTASVKEASFAGGGSMGRQETQILECTT